MLRVSTLAPLLFVARSSEPASVDPTPILPCTTPCKGFKTPPRWEPCLTLDVRCELTTPWSSSSDAWNKVFIDCGIALERAIREIHRDH